MGLFDKIKKTVSENEDKIEKGIDKVEELAHDKLPDKYDAKIDTVADKAKQAVKKIS